MRSKHLASWIAVAAVVVAGGLLAQQLCQIGNLSEPVVPVPGLIQGDEQVFAYLVHPVEQCPCSEGGAQIQEIRMWLQFEPWMIPQNFFVRAGLQRAEWNPDLDRWQPAGYYFEGITVPVEVFDPGLFLLNVPIPNARWMDIHEYYFLTINFRSPLESNLVGDGMDVPGVAYMSPDGGDSWIDLFGFDKTSGGTPIIWGDVLCGAMDPTTGTPVPEAGTRLQAPYPNPFNPSTTLAVVLAEAGPVRLTVHDSKGRLVRVLADETRPAGTWRYTWDGDDAAGQAQPAGLYFFRAETRAGVTSQKAALIK